jgi:hypothetical protein
MIIFGTPLGSFIVIGVFAIAILTLAFLFLYYMYQGITRQEHFFDIDSMTATKILTYTFSLLVFPPFIWYFLFGMDNIEFVYVFSLLSPLLWLPYALFWYIKTW